MELKTYYLYDPKTFVATNSVEAEEQPANSSAWPPPQCAATEQVYFNGQGWVKSYPRSEMTPQRIRTVLKAIAAYKYAQNMRQLNADVSEHEIATYMQQYAEAQQYAATGEAPVFLSTLAVSRDEDLESLVPKILAKAEAYNERRAVALAMYQTEVRDIEAAKELVVTQEMLQHPLLMRA